MTDTISRAFELAKSDQCRSLHEIERRLLREGYDQASEHLNGVMIRRQLSSLLHAAIGHAVSSQIKGTAKIDAPSASGSTAG